MKPNIIMISADQGITEVLSKFLKLRMINVLATGHNAIEAVQLYKKHSPDVVLMDFMMPDSDGLYGLENIRKIDSDARVIMLTDNVNYNIHKKLTESGVSAILQKPYDLNNLVGIIDKISLGDAIQLNNQPYLQHHVN